jgi:aspartyl-tRNA(Asn)/glutamyl-tRNA(Gln) amidotransferase subunit A
MEKPIEGLRIGIPEDYFGAGLDPEVNEKVQAGIALLERLGCRRIPLHMPHTDFATAAYYIIATAEASSNLARYDGVRYGLRVPGATLTEMYRKTRSRGFGPEVKRRIMLGTYVLSAGYYDAYYLRAQKVRALIARDFADAFQKVDVIVTPTAPTPAFRLGEKTADPLQMYLADIYTVTGSLAGVPGISIPSGKTKAGLPVGLQIFGTHFREDRMLQIARAFEKAGGYSI